MMVLPSIAYFLLNLTTFVFVLAKSAADNRAGSRILVPRRPSFLSRRSNSDIEHDDVLVVPRGGGGSSSSNNGMLVEDPVVERRRNYLKDISLALRWTGEMNRQLHEGTSVMAIDDEQNDDGVGAKRSSSSSSSSSLYDYGLRGGGGDGGGDDYSSSTTTATTASASAYRIRDAPSRSRISLETGVPLTPFHAKSPRLNTSTKRRRTRVGASRYGPDLQKYLEHLVDALGVVTSSSSPSHNNNNDYDNPNMPDGDSDESLILTLAMIYLDRACSVETPRSVEGAVPCPFVTPRTVHRLLLCAMVVAVQTVRGETLESMSSALQSLGIPYEQLQQMISWFYSALGDPGLFVAPDQMQYQKQIWDTCFPYPETSSHQNDEPVQQQQQHDGVLVAPATTTSTSTGYYEVEEVGEGEEETEAEDYYQEQQYYNDPRTHHHHHHHAVGVRAAS